MEPLTALAVAGNVLQFVQFAGDLLNSTCKIYFSATGITAENQHVQDICGALASFSARLQSSGSTVSHQSSQNAQAVASCAAACKQDCDELIRLTARLQVKGGSGRTSRSWRSFRAALAEVWKSSEIEDLKIRIADRRQLMTLQLCALSSESLQGISAQLKQLDPDKHRILNEAQDSRLGLLLQKLSSIAENIDFVRSQKHTTQDSVEVLCADISKLSLDTRKLAKESQIMASLDYDDRPLRHEKIPDAHWTTFQWSLDEKASASVKQQSGSFREWLRQKHGLFWVSGKPGSGKSTFMKFIADHEDTAHLLGDWAGSCRLLVASHYFTIYGTLIQRSLEGMLRSLLYEILKKAPELILKALPQYWSEDTERPVSHTSWTQRELEVALRRIATEAGTNVRICLFIDGLDEYTGDHFEICETLKQLSRSSCIKICMSSRPWNVFEDALGGCPKLYMHDLTSKDIRTYTDCVLREHPRWSALEEETSPLSSTSLIDDVVTKANGVFLWVTLVTRLLREGLTNGDSVSDLKKRLSIIPSDLKQFFRHILETVDPFYNEKMAGTLLLALHAKTPLPMEVYMFHDFEYDDENYAFREPTEILSTDLSQVYKRLDSISRRINGRSKGLLERSADSVVFFHRTVFDFLRTPEMEEFLIERARRNFSPVLSTFRAYIAWTKHTEFSGPSPVYSDAKKPHQSEDPLNRMSALATRLRSAFRVARDADEQGENCAALTAALIDNMELSIQGMLSRGQIKGASLDMSRGIYHHLVLEAGISNYIRHKLNTAPDYLDWEYQAKFKSPLTSVLDANLKAPWRIWLLDTLLDRGYCPNEGVGAKSSWVHFLERCFPLRMYASGNNKTQAQASELNLVKVALERGLFFTLLKHGADPEARIEVFGYPEKVFVPAWMLFVIIGTRMLDCPGVFEPLDKIMDIMLSKDRMRKFTSYVLIKSGQTDELEPTAASNVPESKLWVFCKTCYSFDAPTASQALDFIGRLLTRLLSGMVNDETAYQGAVSWFEPAVGEQRVKIIKAKQPIKRPSLREGPSLKRKKENEVEEPRRGHTKRRVGNGRGRIRQIS